MNATTAQTANVLSYSEVVQHDGYTLQEAGYIALGKSKFLVKIQINENSPEVVTWLHGARGGVYTLEPVSLFNANGVHQVISFKSGAPLRVQGNEVRVLLIGNVIEVCS